MGSVLIVIPQLIVILKTNNKKTINHIIVNTVAPIFFILKPTLVLSHTFLKRSTAINKIIKGNRFILNVARINKSPNNKNTTTKLINKISGINAINSGLSQ